MTLERVLEPELMDTPDEARDYDAMDHSEVNRRFVQELLAFAAQHGHAQHGQTLGDVLDLGTGTALIPIELCHQEPACRVMAIDMAVHMLELARYNVHAAGWNERIQLSQVDAKRLPFDDGMFQTVISNSIIHHIPEPLTCLAEMVRVTAPGGILFVRDLMRPHQEGELSRLVQLYAGQESEHARQMFADSLRAALTLDEIRQSVGEVGMPPESVQATSDRHWTWAAVRP